MTINAGQTVTIKRGKLSGQAGEVISVSGTQVALKLTDGTLAVQNETNIKVPDAATITETRLAEVINNAIKSAATPAERDTLYALAGDLERDMPGIQGNLFHVHEV